MATSLKELEGLICAVPDPTVDKGALHALRDHTDVAARQFATRLCTEPEWRHLPLRELLPGVSLLDPASFTDRLGPRAANGLAREEMRTWAAITGMTPCDLLGLSGFGALTVEEILRIAASEWASAYLSSDDSNHIAVRIGRHRKVKALREDASRFEQLRDLVGRAPDPSADRKLLLRLRGNNSPDARWLATKLRTDIDLQRWLLRELLPGLELVDSPAFSDRLSVRAARCIMRVNMGTLRALAQITPVEIFQLPNLGPKTGEEILAAIVSEWALAYLEQGSEARSLSRSFLALG